MSCCPTLEDKALMTWHGGTDGGACGGEKTRLETIEQQVLDGKR